MTKSHSKLESATPTCCLVEPICLTTTNRLRLIGQCIDEKISMLNFFLLPKHLKGRVNVLVMRSLWPLLPPQGQGLIAYSGNFSGAEADEMLPKLSVDF